MKKIISQTIAIVSIVTAISVPSLLLADNTIDVQSTRIMLFPSILVAEGSHQLKTTSEGLTEITKDGYFKEIILNSIDDAQAFIATDGELRGAQLETAFAAVRELNPELTLTDLEIAEDISSIQ